MRRVSTRWDRVLIGAFSDGTGYRTNDDCNGADLSKGGALICVEGCATSYAESIEMPAVMKYALTTETYRLSREKPNVTTKVVLALVMNNYRRVVKTAQKALESSFNNYLNRLDVVVLDEETYYIGKGIIFDKNFKTLVMCKLAGLRLSESPLYSYNKIITHISPVVFNEKNSLNRYIINKMIPFYTSREACNSIRSECCYPSMTESEVVIGRVPDILIRPEQPVIGKDTNDVLNEILIDNIDDISFARQL